MLMFLTRIGFNSKIVINGDLNQCDLPDKTSSGLPDAIEKLKNIKGITINTLNKDDIFRHPLVKDVIKAYE